MCRPPTFTTSSCSASVCWREVREDALPVRPRHAVEAVDVEEVDELLVVDELLFALRQPLGHLLGEACCRAMCSALPPSRMSVPRPAMLVAIVTLPLRPACATISASCAWYFALSTTCLMPRLRSRRRQPLRLLDRHRADQRRPARRLLLEDVVDDGVVLLLLRCGRRDPAPRRAQRAVGRDDDDVEVVDLVELGASVSAVPVMPESFLYLRK